jgi:flagellar protein FlgJ
MGRTALPLHSQAHSQARFQSEPRQAADESGQGDKILSPNFTPGRRLPVVDKSKVDPTLLKAAEGMEAMFLDYMMKVMRQTVPKNDMDLESPATEIYRNMLDTETAQKAARAGGIGLADQIIAYMQPQVYNDTQRRDASLVDQRKVLPDATQHTQNKKSGGDIDASQPIGQ